MIFGHKEPEQVDEPAPVHPILARLWPELDGADLADVLRDADRDEREAQRWLEGDPD